ncbi:Hsp20/alpha crystallin family protein [Desulfonatronovibrio hydrogenovorans]|uniref:Hsp20/alpha crystallin family protein n=1 Tax=Desulfonatronovibrio hydrogenovorans TaxID=53245 RepID=UPI00137786CE|nr:Hsp20/alpha crystallin family protein [Desulfonatronovibrio hydrogenovorans]
MPQTETPENVADFFDDLWSRPFRGFEEFSRGFTPSVEVSEKNDEVTVRAELPGLDPKDIEVSVENNNLVLRGEKKREQKEEKENYVHMECSYGSFHRVIPLRAEVDREKVSAGYKNGVLTIRLPKTVTGRSRKIAIES